MKLKKMFLLLFVVVILTACEGSKTTSNGGGISSKVNSFNVSTPTVSDNESFTLNIDIAIGFDVTVYIRQVGSTDKGSSIYYATYLTGYDSNLTYSYKNGEIASANPHASSYILDAGSYEIYLQVCDLDPLGSNLCVDSSKVAVTFEVAEKNIVDLGYYLKTTGKMYFSDSSISKTVVIQNKGSIEQTYEIVSENQASQTELFRYNFFDTAHNFGTFTIAPGEYDNLTVEKMGTPEAELDGLVEEKFNIKEGGIATEYTARVRVVNVAEEICDGVDTNGICSTPNIKITLSDATPLGGISIGRLLLERLEDSNFILTLDNDFFDVFNKNPRTTCVIDSNNVIATDKQCILIFSKKTEGSSKIVMQEKDTQNPLDTVTCTAN